MLIGFSKIRLILLIALLSIIAPISSFSAPSVTGVSGTLTHDNNVTISGSSFGSKGTAAPIRFERFETADGGGSPTAGHTVAADISYWSDGGGEISSVKSRYDNSTYTCMVLLDSPDDKAEHIYKNSIGFGQKFYINYWVWFTWSDNSSAIVWQDIDGMQHKHLYVMKEFSGSPVEPGVYQQWFWHRGDDDTFETADDETYTYMKRAWSPPPASAGYYATPPNDAVPRTVIDGNGKWINVALQVDQGDANASNGNFEFWQSVIDFGSSYHTGSTSNVRVRDTNAINAIQVGWYITSITANEITIYFDDIYMDTGWSRIEIGDNAVFANCTHREIQTPTAWAAGEITITLNQGSLGALAGNYLFVVDSDGAASSGYLLSAGSSSSVTFSGMTPLGMTYGTIP